MLNLGKDAEKVARTRGRSVKGELLSKSREAALNAVQTFNNPLTAFKTETFIVLMVITWTYLLHAYYRQESIEYRYYDEGPKRRRFDRTKSGAFKYWELERCLNEKRCPLDGPTKGNLRFLIGLRHEIEHHGSAGCDQRFSARYLACCLNYERYICQLFGSRYSLGEAAAFTLQFRDLTATAISEEAVEPLPSNVAKFIQDFDAELPDMEINSPYFRRRFLFVPVVTSKKAQAETVIEFVPADSELAKLIGEEYERIYLKEVERPKYLPGEIVKLMREEGYTGFKMHHHTVLWKDLDAKNPGKGYGVIVSKMWYWYDRWVDEVRKHCATNADEYMEYSKDATAA